MTAPNLPVGVIRNNTDGVSRDLRNIDLLTVEEVAQLWTAYNSKQALLANDIGRRLTNFWWRLWSSEQLRTHLAGSQVALLFERISEGNIIRTTPKSSPRHSRIISASQSSKEAVTETVEEVKRLSRESTETDQEQAVEPASENSDLTVSEQNGSANSGSGPSKSSREQIRPTPILKKPGSESSGAGKTARIQPPAFKTRESDPAHDEPMSPEEAMELSRRFSSEDTNNISETSKTESEPSPVTTRFVEPPARSPALASPLSSQKMVRTSSGSNSARGSRKKPSFVVGPSRKRPVASRRQSSQTGSSSKQSPALKQSRTFDDIPALTEGASVSMRRTQSGNSMVGYKLTASRSASPISGSPYRQASKDHLANEEYSPTLIHSRVISTIAPGSEFVSLDDSKISTINMRRSSSAASFKSGLVTPKRSIASSSSSNIQATGQITVDQPTSSISSTPRRAMTMIGRAGSFLTGKGKNKAMFDLGPADDETPPVSRRPSTDVRFSASPLTASSALASPAATTAHTPAIVQSRSQSQLSDLLDQERKREAQRDRKRAMIEEQFQNRQ